MGSALLQGRVGKPAERDSISLGRGGEGTERRRRNRSPRCPAGERAQEEETK